jgi:hypothetical protein
MRIRSERRRGLDTGAPVRRLGTVVVAGLAVLVLTGAQSSCEQQRSSSGSRIQLKSESRADSSSGGSGGSAGSSSSVSIVQYSVSSDASIRSITYVDRHGHKVTKTNVGNSWSGTGPASHGSILVSATTGSGSSMIRCTVRVHGKVVQRASAVGGGSTTVVCATSY